MLEDRVTVHRVGSARSGTSRVGSARAAAGRISSARHSDAGPKLHTGRPSSAPPGHTLGWPGGRHTTQGTQRTHDVTHLNLRVEGKSIRSVSYSPRRHQPVSRGSVRVVSSHVHPVQARRRQFLSLHKASSYERQGRASTAAAAGHSKRALRASAAEAAGFGSTYTVVSSDPEQGVEYVSGSGHLGKTYTKQHTQPFVADTLGDTYTLRSGQGIIPVTPHSPSSSGGEYEYDLTPQSPGQEYWRDGRTRGDSVRPYPTDTTSNEDSESTVMSLGRRIQLMAAAPSKPSWDLEWKTLLQQNHQLLLRLSSREDLRGTDEHMETPHSASVQDSAIQTHPGTPIPEALLSGSEIGDEPLPLDMEGSLVPQSPECVLEDIVEESSLSDRSSPTITKVVSASQTHTIDRNSGYLKNIPDHTSSLRPYSHTTSHIAFNTTTTSHSTLTSSCNPDTCTHTNLNNEELGPHNSASLTKDTLMGPLCASPSPHNTSTNPQQGTEKPTETREHLLNPHTETREHSQKPTDTREHPQELNNNPTLTNKETQHYPSKTQDNSTKIPDYVMKTPDYVTKTPDYVTKTTDYVPKTLDHVTKTPLENSKQEPQDLEPEYTLPRQHNLPSRTPHDTNPPQTDFACTADLPSYRAGAVTTFIMRARFSSQEKSAPQAKPSKDLMEALRMIEDEERSETRAVKGDQDEGETRKGVSTGAAVVGDGNCGASFPVVQVLVEKVYLFTQDLVERWPSIRHYESREELLKQITEAERQLEALCVGEGCKQDPKTSPDLHKPCEGRLQRQRTEADARIQKNLELIRKLMDDKRRLTEECERLDQRIKLTERRQADRVKATEERHTEELRSLKERLTVAEQDRRERWTAQKTKSIRESTHRALETKIKDLTAKNRDEISLLKAQHWEALRECEEKHRGNLLTQEEEMKRKFEEEKEEACRRERDREQQRLDMELRQSEQLSLSRLESVRKQQEKDLKALIEEHQAALDKVRVERETAVREAVRERERMREECEDKLRKMTRKYEEELATMKEQEERSRKEWKEEYSKQETETRQQAEKELRERLKRQRDKEIERAIKEIQGETTQREEEQRRTYDVKIKNMRERYEAEMSEMECGERAARTRYLEMKSILAQKEEEIVYLRARLHTQDLELCDLQQMLQPSDG